VSGIVVDLGNSRLKWGRVENGRLVESAVLPLDDPTAWSALWAKWQPTVGPRPELAVSSVNPPVAERLTAFFDTLEVSSVHWVRSAADVPVRHALAHPSTTGADRALGALAATTMAPKGRPGLVISCGSAIVVERIDAQGIWHGGAIAPGLGLAARALHVMTALLPLVQVDQAQPPWGAATEPALAAGLFWGAVGVARELITRIEQTLEGRAWKIWTGGDALMIIPQIDANSPWFVPDLVLWGLARAMASDWLADRLV
jgi:type III pantothenate kinase